MSKNSLLPCPFCGSSELFVYPPDDKQHQRERGRAFWGYVSCECGAKCQARYYSAFPDKAREAAVEIWNRRVSV